MNLGMVAFAMMAGLSLSMASSSSDSFLYNNDGECTLPFTSVSVDSLSCTGDREQQQQDFGDACYFKDMIVLEGSFELSQKVNRYFLASFKLCYYGSSNAFYKPMRCKTIEKNIDMRYYAVLKQQYDEEEQVKEGYNYESYFSDEESQKWAEAQQQYENQQDVYSQTYLYPGLYTWNLALRMPSKSSSFGNGSQLHVLLTLTPKGSYTMPYYRTPTYYEAPITDSKYRTQCYLSFQAIPVYEYKSSSYNMYAAGLGFLLLGVASYVSFKRRVCVCGDEQDDSLMDDSYREYNNGADEKLSDGPPTSAAQTIALPL